MCVDWIRVRQLGDFFISLLLTLALISCSKPEAPLANQNAGLRVSVERVTERSNAGELVLLGQIVAKESVRIAPQIDGLRITAVHVDEGARVATGQLLVSLDDAAINAELALVQSELAGSLANVNQVQAQLAGSKSRAALAQAELARYAKVAEIGAVSAADLQSRRALVQQNDSDVHSEQQAVSVALAAKEANQARLRNALARHENLTIKAPAAGILAERNAVVGSIASISDAPLFVLHPHGLREFEAALDLSQLTKLAELTRSLNDRALEVSVQVAGIRQPVRAYLRTQAASVRSADRRGIVRLSLSSDAVAETAIAIGASASASVPLPATQGLWISQSAVLFNPEPMVYVVDAQQRARMRKIQIAPLSHLGQLQVLRGLALDERVVASAAALLTEGLLVRAVLINAAPALRGLAAPVIAAPAATAGEKP